MGGSVYSKDQSKTEAAFKRCTRGMVIEVRPYVLGESLPEILKISAEDQASGSPTAGDMIARNPHHKDGPQWLIAKAEFDLYTLLDAEPPPAVPVLTSTGV